MQAMTDEELRAQGPVVALLRTLLPWITLEPAQDDEPVPPLAQQQPEIPEDLWDTALALSPPLAEHLAVRGLYPDAEGLGADERRQIGREIAAYLLAHNA